METLEHRPICRPWCDLIDLGESVTNFGWLLISEWMSHSVMLAALRFACQMLMASS